MQNTNSADTPVTKMMAQRIVVEDPHLIGALMGSIAFLLFYPLAKWAGLPKPYYLPTEGIFSLSKSADMIAQGYYGSLLWAFGGFFVFYLLGRFLLVRLLIRPRVQRVLMWVTILLFVDLAAIFVFMELGTWGLK